MPQKMPYRLALDMGTNSLGWALIRLKPDTGPPEPCAIIKAGVRIFSDGRNPKDGASLAVTRRNARAMRRRRDRLLRRKNRLLDALQQLGFFPSDVQERKALAMLDPWLLRKEGLERQLSGAEFGRALFHINQRRGFLSNRKTDKKDHDSGALKSAISKLRTSIADAGYKTLGQWLAKRHEEGKSVRARLRGKTVKEKAYDFYADRAMIEHEFDTLWRQQATLNPGLFNQPACARLRDILLYQRPLKPTIPGRCTLLPEERRAALALPGTQRFRIYQELNNLRLLGDNLQEQALSLPQRDILAGLLERGTSTFTAMRKALKLGGSIRFNLEDPKRDRLKGNATSVALAKSDLFGNKWFELSPTLQDEVVLRLLEESSESALIAWLQTHAGVDELHAERIANTGLPEGYGNLSKKALDVILPHLIANVISYDKAVLESGLGSHSALSHALTTGEIMPALPYYGIPLQRHVAFAKDTPRNEEEQYGKIANPTVHIGLNQIRVVVNEIIKQYGHPAEVTIEVTRDLKLSRERKLEIEREQTENQKRNEKLVGEACAILGLNPGHLDKAKRRELSQKMQLWIELNPKDALDRRCPYSGEQLSIERLLQGDVEIEHILPYSRTLDDGMSNKTVAITRANRIKGQQTPFEAFGATLQPGFDYAAILQRAGQMYTAKRQRFAEGGYQIWLKENKDFLARALTDTAYLSRIAREYLSCICPEKHVLSIPGKMTGILRGKMGLNKLLSANTEKNREDHRHHALDAMVIGITDRAMLQRFANASSNAHAKALDKLVDKFELPWPTYRDHVERALQAIFISHKPEHGYQGAIHEETAWGLLGDGQVQRHARPEGGGPRERQVKNMTAIPVSDASQNDRHGVDADGNPKAYKGYLGGSNYCIEIWRNEKGRWESDIVSTFDAYQIIRQHGDAEGWQRLRNPVLSQHGKPLVMRLAKKDCLRLDIDGKTRTMVIAKISGNGQIFMADHNEANVDARNRDKDSPFAYVSKYAGSLYSAKARRCTITPAGRLRDPGFKE